MENTKRRNATLFRIAAVILMFTLVTTCFASSTFAKYTSSAEGKATATVAKWDITVTDKDGAHQLGVAQVDNLAFKFAETWNNTRPTNPAPSYSGNTVVQDLIAPGTEGSFNVKVKNESDVAAHYTIKLAYDASSETQLPATLVLYSDAQRTQPITLNGTNLVEVAAGDLDIGSSTPDEDTVTIYWRWIFEDGTTATDTADTQKGVDARSASLNDVIFRVAIVVDQID